MPHTLFSAEPIILPEGGPLYLQLKRWIEAAIARAAIRPGDALPSERDLAIKVDVSRVTVCKAVQQLVREGVLVQRHGSGTYVAPEPQRVEQSLSQLTSFAEDMARRGLPVRSIFLDCGIYDPSPEETLALGLSPGERVTRIAACAFPATLRSPSNAPSLAATTLPDPKRVGESLYALLDAAGNRPVRAIQRIRAANLGEADAKLLEISAGAAALHIERVAYLASGRVVEFTRSVYRGDTYDFVAELRVAEGTRS